MCCRNLQQSDVTRHPERAESTKAFRMDAHRLVPVGRLRQVESRSKLSFPSCLLGRGLIVDAFKRKKEGQGYRFYVVRSTESDEQPADAVHVERRKRR